MIVSPDFLQAVLERRVDVLARWLVFWTGLVALGLLLEYGSEAAKWKPNKNVRTPRSFVWVPLWAFMGGALIVGGVAGELYVEFLASRAENNLREFMNSANTTLKTDAGNAITLAGNAITKAAKLEKEAASLRGQAAELTRKNLATESKLAEANDKLEQEKITRLEMEKSLAPRLLPFRKFSDGTTNIDDLKLLKGTTVRIVYVPDAEAARAAANLAYLFGAAGWKIASVGPIDKLDIEKLGLDGITLESYVAPRDPNLPSAEIVAEWRSTDTTSAVMKWLRENEWEANLGFTDHGEITPDSIRVRVGLKPYPYFEDADSKRFRDEENKRLHIDPKRYKNKTIVAEFLRFGGFLKYGRISPPKK